MIQYLSTLAVPALLLIIPVIAAFRRLPVYDLFVEGAAEGLGMVWKILPFLLGMLVAIAVFRASGLFELLIRCLQPLCRWIGIPAEVVPLALMRPLSGSGALALTTEIFAEHGPDSFIGLLASVMQGSTDTTFYILAVYFGSVGIKKHRYALPVGLSADMVSFICAAMICRIFFAS